MGQIILVANWLLEGNFKKKFTEFFSNKTALVITSLFLLHIIGLIYTTDFSYAFKDLRTKLPMLVIPLIIVTSERMGGKMFHNFLLIFIAACFVSTLISMYYFFTLDFVDIRDICVLVSHIRLSLMICLSVLILFYFVISDARVSIRINKIILFLMLLWFVYFLIILESITGLGILLIIAFGLALTGIFKLKLLKRIIIIVSMLAVSLLLFYHINNISKDFSPSVSSENLKLPKFTSLGNLYFNDTLNKESENGYYVWVSVCEPEMREAWNKRSNYKFDGRDRKEQYIKGTLVRFLTSKGLRKDAEGVNSLTADEVRSVEKGVANVKCQNKHSLRTRIYETLWEYKNYSAADPNGHSVLQRLEYWKASLGIISENLLFGVGTGDMETAFKQQYKKNNSPLDEKFRLRSHNQFLSVTVGFGIIGLLWFLIVLIFPFFTKWVRRDYFYIIFFAISILSMVAEDTIESQAGLTFFVFFNSFFLLGRKPD